MKIKVSPLHCLILSWHQASPYRNLLENKPKETITEEKEKTNGHLKQWSFKNVTISFVEDIFGRLAKISICWGNSHFIYKNKHVGIISGSGEHHNINTPVQNTDQHL